MAGRPSGELEVLADLVDASAGASASAAASGELEVLADLVDADELAPEFGTCVAGPKPPE